MPSLNLTLTNANPISPDYQPDLHSFGDWDLKGPQWWYRIGWAFVGLRDKQSETIEDRIREPMTKLRDKVDTCIHCMEIEREEMHTMGWQWDAGSSGRSLSRRRVRGNEQVYKVIGGISIYQGDKRIWRMLGPIWRLSRLRFLIKSKCRLFYSAPSQLVGQQPEYNRPSNSPNYSPVS